MPSEKDEYREKRILMHAVVDGYGPEERAIGWYYYLENELRFPFKARCSRHYVTSPLKKEEVYQVVGMAEIEALPDEFSGGNDSAMLFACVFCHSGESLARLSFFHPTTQRIGGGGSTPIPKCHVLNFDSVWHSDFPLVTKNGEMCRERHAEMLAVTGVWRILAPRYSAPEVDALFADFSLTESNRQPNEGRLLPHVLYDRGSDGFRLPPTTRSSPSPFRLTNGGGT